MEIFVIDEVDEYKIEGHLNDCIDFLEEERDKYVKYIQILYRIDDKYNNNQERRTDVLNNYAHEEGGGRRAGGGTKKYSRYYKLLILIKELILTIEYSESTPGIKEDKINMLQEFKKYYPELNSSLDEASKVRGHVFMVSIKNGDTGGSLQKITDGYYFYDG